MTASRRSENPTLEQVIEGHQQALGGLDALRATALHRAVSRILGANAQDQTAVVDELTGRIVAHVSVPSLGMKLTKGFDGALAWEQGPMFDGYHGRTHPETLRLARMPRALWAAPGGAKLLGEVEDSRGARCLAVERRTPNEAGQEVPLRELLDATTLLLRESIHGDGGEEVRLYDDYREVAGRLWPFRIVHKMEIGDNVEELLSVETVTPGDVSFRHPDKEPPGSTQAHENANVASLHTIWEIVDQVYFDPSFGGVDWPAAFERYRPRVEQLEAMGDASFVALATQMLNELKATHYVIVPRDHVRSGEARIQKPGRTGLELRHVEGRAVVYRAIPGTAASSSPLRPGFVVTAINGKDDDALTREHGDAIGYGVNELRARIAPYALELRARAGERVRIDYLDGDDRPASTELVATEQEVQMDPIFGASVRDGVLVVSFRVFVGSVVDAFRGALHDHPNSAGLILDLRGNPGGVAQIPVALAAIVTEGATTLGRFIYRSQINALDTEPEPDPFRGPVAVLQDAFSGSCSELLAGFLQESGRARVFGRRSAGAVLPSTQTLLANGCSFQYVVCDYETAGGRRLEGVGVIPDDGDMVQRRADLLAGLDPDMDAALAWIARARA